MTSINKSVYGVHNYSIASHYYCLNYSSFSTLSFTTRVISYPNSSNKNFFFKRDFSSNKFLLMPSKVDVSVFSEDTTDKDLQEYKDNQIRKVTEFKDRHSEEELYDKTAVFDEMDKDSAKALKEEIESDLMRDTSKLKEELREDMGDCIEYIRDARITEESKERVITSYREDLNANLEDADKVCNDRL